MRLPHIIFFSCILILFAAPVLAQEPPSLQSVDPNEGSPGQELELVLRGSGFGDYQDFVVIIGDLDIFGVEIAGSNEIIVHVFIPDDAPPGPRAVELIPSFGQNEEAPELAAVLEGGFTVLPGDAPAPPGPEPSEPPQPSDDGGGLGWLLWIIVTVVGLAGLGLVARLRRSALRRQWQAEAQEGEAPEPCQPGRFRTQREKPELKPGRWRVVGLKVTLYDAAGGRRAAIHKAPDDLVKWLDKAARQRLLRGESEALADQVGEMAQTLANYAITWQTETTDGRDLYLETRLEGGEASVKFIRQRCLGQPGRWQNLAEWTIKLKAVDTLPGSVRGPEPGEAHNAYRAFLEQRLAAYIADLVQEAGRLL